MPQSVNDDIRTVCRIRPINDRETAIGVKACISTSPHSTTQVIFQSKQVINFDYVANETSTQHEIFDYAGLTIIENCLLGYNSTCLCYGQSGSGLVLTT
jgi:kinesin family protein 15